MHPTKDDCYTTSVKYCVCIEFQLDEECRHGFHTSQLIDYTLEANPDADEDKNTPPQRLALAFSTADVVILGWRLGRLTDLLRESELATVHVLPRRYGDLDRGRPFVASIIITPLSRGQS
ncbi:MAG TPA: hypothetical protein VL171_17950 [Verrucomicrobiae bacterium]|nr:hypothetical protein [Verrucomicrobiae bacterium]